MGGVVGIALILLAAVFMRPFAAVPENSPYGVMPASQMQGIREFREKMSPLRADAVTLVIPVQTMSLQGSYQGQSAKLDADIQVPINTWNGLALLAMALGALVSLMVGRPQTVRAAALQGAATCVPVCAGLLIIASLGQPPVPIDMSVFGPAAAALSGAQLSVSYGFPLLPIAAYTLIVGGLLGAVLGVLHHSYVHRQRLGEAFREMAGRFAGPVGGAALALVLALAISLPAVAAIWMRVKGGIPASAYIGATQQQVLATFDRAVLEGSPSLAFYAYGFGHGVPLTASVVGGADVAGQSENVDAVARMSVLGVTAEEAKLGKTPVPPFYEWWVYLLPLLPVIPLTMGGYLSAAWSRTTASSLLEGAKVAIPYAAAMLGLAWLTSFAMRASVSQVIQADIRFSLGADYLFTGLLALAWGATFGALGGWLRHKRVGKRQSAVPVMAPIVPAPPQ